jgi:hypothetical protein
MLRVADRVDDAPAGSPSFVEGWRAVSMLSCGWMPGVMGAMHLAQLVQVQPCLDAAYSDSHIGRLKLGEFVFPQDNRFCLVGVDLICDFPSISCLFLSPQFLRTLF